MEFKGSIYHLTSGRNTKQAIFLDEKDFTDFLGLLCQVVKRREHTKQKEDLIQQLKKDRIYQKVR